MTVLKKIISTLLLASLLLVPVHAQEAETSAPYDGYIVKLKANQALMTLMDSDKESTLEPVKYVDDTYTTENLDTVKSLEDLGALEYYEPNYIAELFDIPNDPYYTSLAENQWDLDMMSLPYAWKNDINGFGVRIGIIDSGVYAGHEDFAGVDLSRGYNFVNSNNDLSDSLGHGTFVTSMIAAATNNGVGIAGIAPGAQIVTLKCFDTTTGATYSSIVSALAKATAPIAEGGYDCDIINMSFGGAADSATLSAAINAASGAGAILIASVGNDYSSTLMYPAAYDCVIGVGAVDWDGVIGSFSNHNSSVDLVAPGVSVCGLDNSAGQYLTGSGTSFSAPCVTAVAALAKSVDADMSSDDFVTLIRETSEDLGEAGRDDEYGFGLINADLILRCIKNDGGMFVSKYADRFNVYGVLPTKTDIGSCSIIIACNDVSGKMSSIDLVPSEANAKAQLILPVQALSLPEDVHDISIYILNSSNVPLNKKTRYLTSEFS